LEPYLKMKVLKGTLSPIVEKTKLMLVSFIIGPIYYDESIRFKY